MDIPPSNIPPLLPKMSPNQEDFLQSVIHVWMRLEIAVKDLPAPQSKEVKEATDMLIGAALKTMKHHSMDIKIELVEQSAQA